MSVFVVIEVHFVGIVNQLLYASTTLGFSNARVINHGCRSAFARLMWWTTSYLEFGAGLAS